MLENPIKRFDFKLEVFKNLYLDKKISDYNIMVDYKI